MILVDTSVWIDHFRGKNRELVSALDRGEAACHSFVIGELACGNLQNRRAILTLLAVLPQIPTADDSKVLELIDGESLFGKGLGWIDFHLLTAALAAKIPLFTLDRRLGNVARVLLPQ